MQQFFSDAIRDIITGLVVEGVLNLIEWLIRWPWA